MSRLEGKVAIITGGNSGIGAKTAALFAKEGAKVVISARRLAQLEEVAEAIRAEGGEVLSVTCDISKADQCAALVEKTLETFGTIDILINNAGVVDSGIDSVEKVSDETIDTLIDINTKGTIYVARDCAKVMFEKKSGSIVNVASVVVLPVTNVANFQFILSQRLNRDRFSFPNLVNPVNPVKKTLSLRASVVKKKMGIL